MGRRFPITYRFTLALVLALAVPVGALVGLGGYIQQAIRADVEQKVEATLELAYHMEENLLREGLVYMQQASAATAADPAVVAALSESRPGIRPALGPHAPVHTRADILLVVDREGTVMARAGSESTGDRVLLGGLVPKVIQEGVSQAFPALIHADELRGESGDLLAQIDMPINATRGSTDPRVGGRVDTALTLAGVAPVYAADGRVVGAVVAADVLNRDFRIVDAVAGWSPNAIPLHATIAMDGIRVTTTVRATDPDGNKLEARALGTIYSDKVMDSLRATGIYRGAAEVVGQAQQTVYKEMTDFQGRMIAAAYVGVPEAYFNTVGSQLAGPVRFALLAGGAAFVLLLGLAAWLMYRGILRPVRLYTAAVLAGQSEDLVPHTNDELGDLALAIRQEMVRTTDALQQMEEVAGRMAAVCGDLHEAAAEADEESVRAVSAAASGMNAVSEVQSGAAPTLSNLKRLDDALRAVGEGVRREERSVLYLGRVVQEIESSMQEARRLVEDSVADAGRLASEARSALKQAGEWAAGVALLRQGNMDDRTLDLLRDPSAVLTAMAAVAERVAGQAMTLTLQVQENQTRLAFIQEEMGRVEAVVRETAGRTRQAGDTAEDIIGWMETMAGHAEAVAGEVFSAQSYLDRVAGANRRLSDTCKGLQEEVEAFRHSLQRLRG